MIVLDAHADPVTFAREVLGVEVFDYQAQALRSTAPVVVVAGGRRSGKSAASQYRALWTAFTRRNAQVIVATANERKGREWLRECAGLLRGSVLRAELDDQATRLFFPGSGSSIIVVPPTAGQIRGFGRDVFLLLVDEAGFLPAGFWRDARYVLLDNLEAGAQAWIVGSPWGGPEHFFRQAWDLGMAGDPGYAAFQWRTAMNPRLPAGWIEQERARLSPHERGAELDGEWGSAEGAFFSWELLRRQVADVVVPPLRSLVGAARPMVGVDWGHKHDQSSAVLLYRLPVRDLNPAADHVPRFLALPYVWPAGHELTSVVDDIVNAPVRYLAVSPETNGVGAMPSQEIRRRLVDRNRRRAWRDGPVFNPTFSTAATKTAGYGAILALLERGQLVLPRHPELLRQLAGLRFEQQRGGAMRFEAEDEATHDDIADGLYLATGVFTQRGRGRHGVQVRALHAAEAGRVVDDWRVYERDFERAELVQTEGGLRVWARPLLQSAYATGREGEFGPGLTYPVGWRS